MTKFEKYRSLKKIENLRRKEAVRSESKNKAEIRSGEELVSWEMKISSKSAERDLRNKDSMNQNVFQMKLSPRNSKSRKSKKRKISKRKFSKEKVDFSRKKNLKSNRKSTEIIDIYNTILTQNSPLNQQVQRTSKGKILMKKQVEKSFIEKFKGNSASKKSIHANKNFGWISKNLNKNPRSSLKLTKSSLKPSFNYGNEISKMMKKNQFKNYLQKLKKKKDRRSSSKGKIRSRRRKSKKKVYTPSKSKLDSIERTLNLNLKTGPQGTSVVQINNYVRDESSKIRKIKRSLSSGRGKKKSDRLSRFMKKDEGGGTQVGLVHSVRERLKKGKIFGNFFR